MNPLPTSLAATPPASRPPALGARPNATNPASEASPSFASTDPGPRGSFARVMANAAERESRRPSGPARESARADDGHAAKAAAEPGASDSAAEAQDTAAPDAQGNADGSWAGVVASAAAVPPAPVETAQLAFGAHAGPGSRAAATPDAASFEAAQAEADATAPVLPGMHARAPRAIAPAHGAVAATTGPTEPAPASRPKAVEATPTQAAPRIATAEWLERRIESAVQRAEPSPMALPAAARAVEAPAVHALPLPAPAASYTLAHAGIAAAPWQPQFAEQFAQRVTMFAAHRVQVAELALNPADLGPVSVSIEVRGTETTLAFGAAHAATRAAIEDALPRLRDMLSGQGLQLAHASVDDQPRRAWPAAPTRGGIALRAERDSAVDANHRTASAATVRRPVRLIDVVV